MSIFDILLAVSIIAESFPISSSGHLVLIEYFLKKEYVQSFSDIVNHVANISPALLLPLFFYDQWLVLWHALLNHEYAYIGTVLLCGFIAEIITVAWYIFFSCVGTTFFPLFLGFFVSGCLLYSLRWCAPGGMVSCFTIKNFFVLGMAQGLALLPGVSRLGSTFVAARWLGLNNQQAFFIASLIQWPISVAGFFKGLLMLEPARRMQLLNPHTLLIMLISMVIAYGGLYGTNYVIKQNGLTYLAWYLLCISILAYSFNV